MLARIILLTLFSAFLPLRADDPGPIRVACVGDSITEGFGIGNPANDSYPAQLQKLLGPKWEVKNFGASGTTLARHGNKPYWDNPKYAAAKAFAPQVVVIMLGTNDCIPRNAATLKSDFVSDYKSLIKTFTDLESHPKIWICNLAPVAPSDYAKTHHLYVQSIDQQTVQTVGLPFIARVASDTNIPLIDVNAALQNHFDLYSDSVHPNGEGAKIIAHTVYDAIKDFDPRNNGDIPSL
jgi:lysophospholipase L1-like esterase